MSSGLPRVSEPTDELDSIVVLKTGPYPELAHSCGDFEDWTVRGLGVAPEFAVPEKLA